MPSPVNLPLHLNNYKVPYLGSSSLSPFSSPSSTPTWHIKILLLSCCILIHNSLTTPNCLHQWFSNFICRKIMSDICLKLRFQYAPSHSDTIVHFLVNKNLVLGFFKFFKLFIFLNWSIIYIQYCVCFRYIAKLFRHIYTVYTYSCMYSSWFFSVIGYCKILNIVPCAMQ